MSHSTPATLLVWAVLSVLLGIFLVHHLYRYDRFKCLKWNYGLHSGAFKRIMTYTYLINIPLIAIYSIGFAVIKYKMGWTTVPGVGIMPTPWTEWPKMYQHAILPLYLIFSIGWSLEIVTHLEELCFWLFLVNAGRAQQDWFRSGYFKVWVAGSIAAVIYMPLVTIFTRANPLKNEAATFLAGSLGSLVITICFTPILWTFPRFVEGLRSEGVDMETVLRLIKFHELNTIRIVFRFIFTISLAILGADGTTPHTHVNDSCFWTEFLAILAGIGVTVSSGITLVIFFPRSIEKEYNLKQSTQHKSTFHLRSRVRRHDSTSLAQPSPESIKSYTSEAHIDADGDRGVDTKNPFDVELDSYAAAPMTFAPNRRLESGAMVRGGVMHSAARARDPEGQVHPFVQHYRSPIDLMEGEDESLGHPMRRR